MAEFLFKCRFCKRRDGSPTDGVQCLGCGAPYHNALDNSKPKKNVRVCPGCKPNRYETKEPGRFLCKVCGVTFEDDEVHSLHDRPDVAFEKKEAYWNRRRGR